MNKKICVYAIAKNENKFIDRWYDSVKEADYVCVLDTGSTDGSFEKFKKLGIITKQKKYNNFRFDEARNDSLKLIPKDTEICVCVDIDEYFEKGWSKILKDNWKDNTGRARYRYTWNFNNDGSEGIVFMADKIHRYGAYCWKNPVHEILMQTNNEILQFIDLPNIQLNHKADNKKSRSNYLPLLELSVKENPNDDRNMHYLGREYMFYGQYDNAIKTLKKHLKLPSAKWPDERSASLRFIGNCYKQKKQYKKAEKYFLLAILEANHIREPYFDLATLYYERKQYLQSIFVFEEMLKINNRYLNYISSPLCWSSLPYDYISMCYYYLKDYNKAIEYVDKAIELSDEQRLKDNKFVFIQNNINSHRK